MSGNNGTNPISTSSLHEEDITSNNERISQAMNIPKNKKQKFQKINLQNSGVVHWHKFWVVKADDPNVHLAKTDPFVIDKAIEGMVGQVKSVTGLRSGHLLIEVDCLSHANNLEKTKKLAHIPVEASPHRTLNSSKAIIYCDRLDELSNEQIQEELSPQGVTDVHRIISRRNGQEKPTNVYVLTFNTPDSPKTLKIGYLRVKTKLYIPNPRRCYNCQKFGHGKNTCNRKTVCDNCGEDDHGRDECPNETCCPNCQGHHSAGSRGCPEWEKQKSILKLQYTNKISYREAKAKHEQQTTPLQKQISAGAAPTFSSTLAMPNKQILHKDREIQRLTDENNALKTRLDLLAKEMRQLQAKHSLANRLAMPLHEAMELEKNKKRSRSSSGEDDSESSSPEELSAKQVKSCSPESEKDSRAPSPLSSTPVECPPTGLESPVSKETGSPASEAAGPLVSNETGKSSSAETEESGWTVKEHKRSRSRKSSTNGSEKDQSRSLSRSPLKEQPKPQRGRSVEQRSKLPKPTASSTSKQNLKFKPKSHIGYPH